MSSAFRPDLDGLRAILSLLPDTVVLVIDRDFRLQYINQTEPGYTAASVIGTSAFNYVDPHWRDTLERLLTGAFERSESGEFETASIPAGDARPQWYASRVLPMHRDGEVIAALLVARNVTALKLAEESRMLAEAEVRTLGQLLPICAWCKNVRNDRGYWDSVETYISGAGAILTHSVCPSCAAKLLAPDDDAPANAPR